MYHVIFAFLQLFRMKPLRLSSEWWKLVFRLPAAGEVGDEILFGFSFWPLRTRDRLVATRLSGELQQGFLLGF
jgi:hypothetical protein